MYYSIEILNDEGYCSAAQFLLLWNLRRLMDNLELSNVDVHALRKLYKSNPAARLLLDCLAARKDNRRITTVSSLHSYLTRAAYDISRKDIIETFKELQRLNCGDYVNGKPKGETHIQSRFIWKVNLVSVGLAATDKKLRT